MDVKFFVSSDITLNVRVKLLSLIGNPPPLIYTAQPSALSANGKNIPLPITSNFHLFDSKKEWNEWLTFNIKYKNLPLSTQLVFTVWYSAAPGERRPLGGTCMSLFNHKRKLRKGRQRLILWQGREGDASSANPTPGKLPALEDINRVDRMRKQFDRNDRSHVAWLDNAVKEKVYKLCDELEADLVNKGLIVLLIELPSFEYPVVFREEGVRPTDLGLGSETPSSVYLIMPDPEMTVDINPVENKHRIITYRRRRRRGLLDKDVQPNAAERKQIIKILRYPPSRQLPPEDRDFLWNFRTYLKNDKKALTKFLKCVNWTDEKDVQQAAELLNVWEPIDVADALELLSVTFREPIVRKYAVSRIAIADDEELLCYLLQLVQALRYEANTEFGPLAEFLMERAAKSSDLGYYFFWYVTVECEDKRYKDYYTKLRSKFEQILTERNCKDRFDMLVKQKQMVERLTMLAKDVKNTRSGKTQRLREQAPGALRDVFPVYLPLYPAVCCLDVMSEKANVFPSAMQPLKLVFRTKTEDYSIIYKNGDDLRQDQLVIQIFRLMDRLLKKENLDLKLLPYRVLATDLSNGMLEFVHSSYPVSAVISTYGNNIKKFLEKCHPDPSGPFGIKAEVLETFVKSCAGYCVFTYILGVGDRHMDNLMLTEAGNLFHIDFGFILGNDPKAFPPPFKLSPQMVEAMGGTRSDYYYRFKSYCCEAFNILRKSASLIVNLFSLMRDAGIPQIDGDRGVKIIEDNLRLELTDEEAIKVFQQLIAESANALIPQVNDGLHSIASRWRSYWAR